MNIRFKIAIITPVYNGEHTIENSIKSLINQTFYSWVNIIVNDGSTDRTAEILKKYKSDPRFIIIDFPENKGRPYARQAALDKTIEIGAKYMCMLDADDLYYSDKLAWQFEFMENNPDVCLLSSSIGYIDNDYNLKGVFETYKEVAFLSLIKLSDYKNVPHASSIIRVNNIDVNYDPNLKLGQDQDFMMRLLLNKKYVFIPKISYLYNRELSFSFKKYKKSIDLASYTRKKKDYNRFALFLYKIIDIIKIIIVGFLCLFGMKNMYFKKIGRNPTKEELSVHKSKLIY